MDPILLGQRHRLDHGKALPGPVGEIQIGFFAGEPVEQLPGGITEPEEGAAIAVFQPTPVACHPQARSLG